MEMSGYIVFIPKYRKKVLWEKVREDVREIIPILYEYKGVEIITGVICVNQVYFALIIPDLN